MSLPEYTITKSVQKSVPTELKACPQWLTWYYGPPRSDGKRPKVPTIPGTRRKAAATSPETWGTYDAARSGVQAGRADGVGFVVTDADPYVGIDLDDCRDPETGAVEPWAMAVVERLNTYTEISPSGTGLHIIGRGVKPGGRCRSGEQIECYDAARYLTVTGDVLSGYTDIRNCQRELTRWYREVWPEEIPEPTPMPTASGDELSAERIIAHLSDHPKKGTRFRDLFDGGLGGFPSPSEARYALIGMCNPYTTDTATVEAVVRASGQWSEKCEARPELVRGEIRKSIKSYRGPRYSPGQSPEPPPEPLGSPGLVDVGPIDEMTCDEVRAQLKQAQVQIARQAQMIRDERELRRGIEQILASPEIELGPRVTAIASALEIAEQQRRGRQSGEYGYRVLASWIAKRTGQKAKTVTNHLNQLQRLGLIDREVVTERVPIEELDHETGEILETTTPRRMGYIRNEPTAIITNITEYRRQAEEPKHGGTRTPKPRCEKHPDAGTVIRTETICAAPGCDTVLDATETYCPPDPEALSHSDPEPVELRPTGTEGSSPRTSPLTVVPDPDDANDEGPVSGPPRKCWECHQLLDIGQHTLCPDCAAKHQRERAQVDRARRAGTRPCAQCGEPTATREARYCPEHGGVTGSPEPTSTEPTSASWAAP